MSQPRRSVIASALGRLPAPARKPVDALLDLRDGRRAAALLPDVPPAPATRLLVGPLNTAGQGTRWARAASDHLGVTAHAMVAARSGRRSFGYDADVVLPSILQRRGLPGWERAVLRAYTHLLLERGRGVTHDLFAPVSQDLLRRYADAGLTVAALLHGSEIRDHARHAELYEASPFRAEPDDYLDRVQAEVDTTRALLDRSGLAVIVPTLDLLDFVEDATWLPVTVDVQRFAAVPTQEPLTRAVPVVLHAPSNPVLKGTGAIEPVLERLDEAGRIVYRRLEGVPHDEMPAFVAGADVVVDQIVLGNLGGLAAESEAAGRLVVAHVSDRVRARLDAARVAGPVAGLAPEADLADGVPVVDATPRTFSAVMDEILADRPRYRDLAARGPAWARAYHDGRAAAAALAPFLGIAPPEASDGARPSSADS